MYYSKLHCPVIYTLRLREGHVVYALHVQVCNVCLMYMYMCVVHVYVYVSARKQLMVVQNC